MKAPTDQTSTNNTPIGWDAVADQQLLIPWRQSLLWPCSKRPVQYARSAPYLTKIRLVKSLVVKFSTGILSRMECNIRDHSCAQYSVCGAFTSLSGHRGTMIQDVTRCSCVLRWNIGRPLLYSLWRKEATVHLQAREVSPGTTLTKLHFWIGSTGEADYLKLI